MFNYLNKILKYDKVIFSLGGFAVVFYCWSLLSYLKVVDNLFLPTPSQTFSALIYLLRSPDFLLHLATSLTRILIAFGLASIVGVGLGILAGSYQRFYWFLIPVNSSFRYIPPTAFISLTIIWFGIEEVGKIALIFIAVIFYVIQMTSDVVKQVPTTYKESAKMLGVSRSKILLKVIIPYAFPDILAVLRVNLGAAWTFLIVSELVASQRGLGYLMATNQRFLKTPNVFALMIIIGVLGYISDSIFASIIKASSNWRV